MSTQGLFETLPAAFEAALAGEIVESERRFQQLAASKEPWARAGQLAILALRWMVEPERARVVTLEELRELGSSNECRLARQMIAGVGIRRAVLDFDPRRLDQWREAVDCIAADSADAVLARSWWFLGTGEPTRSLDSVALLPASSATWQRAEALAVRALAMGECGRIEEAVDLARRVSRDVRDVPVLYARVLGQIVLARMRRLSGRSVLATRILMAMRPHAPRSWERWLRWELFLASGEPTMVEAEDLATFPDDVLAAVRAAETGDGEQYVGLERRPEVTWAPFARERRMGIDVLDPRVERPTETVEPWVRGRESLAPPAIRALTTRGVDEVKAGLVAAGFPFAARRFCESGIALLPGDPVRLEATNRSVRTLTLLAVLTLLSTESAETSEVFHSVYGFRFDAGVHAGLFRVLVHRARKLIGNLGTLESEGGRMRLVWHRPVVFVDPRGQAALEDSVLRFLAKRKAGRAREAAGELNVPLRTVQQALQKLSEEGAIDVAKDGRRLVYSLEDTSFSRTGLFGDPGQSPQSSK